MDFDLFAALSMGVAGAADAPALEDDAGQVTHSELRRLALARSVELLDEEALGLCSLDAFEERHTCIEFCAHICAGATVALFAANEAPARRERLLASIAAWRPKRRAPGTSFDGRLPIDVVFTSGSSGEPRPVVHGLMNHAMSADGAAALVPFGPGHRWLSSLPLHHIGGLAIWMRALRSGGAVVLRRQGERIAEAIARTRPTHCSLVARQVSEVLDGLESGDEERGDALQDAVRGLQAVLVGGGPVPRDLVLRARAHGLPVHATYGMTETTAQVATAARFDATSVGAVLPFREVRLRDGEILVRGPTVALGQVVGADLLPLCDDDAWFATGDLGELDAEGRLRVLGRKDRRFVSGGENVSPEEIEAALRELTKDSEAYVVARSDARWGARPIAFVRDAVPAPEGSLIAHSDEGALRRALTARLPRYLVPDRIFALPPRSTLKQDLAALARLGELAAELAGETKGGDDAAGDADLRPADRREP